MDILSKIVSRPAKKSQIIKVSFSEPWWVIFLKQKGLIYILLAYTVVEDSLNTLLPLFLEWVISNQSVDGIVALAATFISLIFAGWFLYSPNLVRLHTQTYDSFRYNAFKTLLSIDPIYHIQRPSGAIIGKIQRTNNAFLELSSVVVEDAVPLFIELTTLFISMFWFDSILGLMVLSVVLVLTISFTLVVMNYTEDIEIDANKKDDVVHQKNIESLSQFQFIRSTFATNHVKEGLKSVHLSVMRAQSKLWMSYKIIRGLFLCIYFVALGVIAYYLIGLTKANHISTGVAISLAFTFLRGTKGIFKISKWMKNILKSYRLIKDFYSFIRVFGRQTYPIFDDDKSEEADTAKNSETLIKMSCITFAYPGQPEILKNNSLDLTVLDEYKNKLFGLIGPSGIGKTTILSILGGQLKPEEGKISINGIDIYKVDDNIRRELIAIQGQVATSLRGSLRYNVLFGLPDYHEYSDAKLIEVLNAVGLWRLFKDKDGLNTFIGEGGLNLSGGQRQRLNFANLYLRAKFFRPLLILIDEPTSSLDEISEKAITEMIYELSTESVTFVIAHRLKTLEDAYEILDFSLIEPGTNLTFYKPEELKQKSEYFRKLIEGATLLEE